MYQKVKGTIDYYGTETKKLQIVSKKVKDIIENFGYEEVVLPIIENTEVFTRSSGETSDIVRKEMYTFEDRGKRSLTLRPEGTAGIVRFFLESKEYANLDLKKYYYFGPMFRYERPQKGRYRQFIQFGVEVFGKSSYLLDVDVIYSAYAIFKALGIKNIRLRVNTIGDFGSRKDYALALKEYFKPKLSSLCPDCNERYATNPLRILDCKVDSESEALKKAPKIKDYLSEESKLYFKNLLEALDMLEVPYEVDDTLVRGLDYYTDVVFEFEAMIDGSYLTVCGGGKYSDLVKNMGGPDLPGIGYSFGIERLIELMSELNLFEDLDPKVDLVIISLDENTKKQSLKIANDLRSFGYKVELDYSSIKMKQQFRLSEKLNASLVLIYGEEEDKNKEIQVKNQKNGTQEKIKIKDLEKYLGENL